MPTSIKSLPIGVFDSGVGGISVLHHIRELLPNERLLYLADSLHAPYGSKSAEYINQRAHVLTEWLIQRGAKAIVVACNTATAVAVHALRQKYTLPIIGMEPAVKPAAAATRNGVIGVLATSGTLKSAQFAALLDSYGRHVQVVTQACVGLVECIERGELDSPATRQLLIRYLMPLLEAKADTIVLGCTHYPFVRPLIERIVHEAYLEHAGVLQDTGSRAATVCLIDTGNAVARHLRTRLEQAQILAATACLAVVDSLADAQRLASVERLENPTNKPLIPTPAAVEFWTNSALMDAEQTICKLWGGPASVRRLAD